MTVPQPPSANSLIREMLDAGNDDVDAIIEKVLRHLDTEAIMDLVRRKLRADVRAEQSTRARKSAQLLVKPTEERRNTITSTRALRYAWEKWLDQTEALGDGVRRRVGDLSADDITILIDMRQKQVDALKREIDRFATLREAMIAEGAATVKDMAPRIID